MIRNMYTLLFEREVVDYVHTLEFDTANTRRGRHTCITILKREVSVEPPFILPENSMCLECNRHQFPNKTHHNAKVMSIIICIMADSI